MFPSRLDEPARKIATSIMAVLWRRLAGSTIIA